MKILITKILLMSLVTINISSALQGQSEEDQKLFKQCGTLLLGELKALVSICRESSREIDRIFNQLNLSLETDQKTLFISLISEWSKIGYQAGDLVEKIVSKLQMFISELDAQEMKAIAQSIKQAARKIDTLKESSTSIKEPLSSVLSDSTKETEEEFEKNADEVSQEIKIPETLTSTFEEKTTPITEENVPEIALAETSTSSEDTFELNREQPDQHDSSANKTSEDSKVFDDIMSPNQNTKPIVQTHSMEKDPLEEINFEQKTIFNTLPPKAPTIEMVRAYGPILEGKENSIKYELQQTMENFEEKFPGINFLTFISDIKQLYTYAQASAEYTTLLQQTKNEQLIKELQNKILQADQDFVDLIIKINKTTQSTGWYTLYKK